MQRVLAVMLVVAMVASVGALFWLRSHPRTPTEAEDYAHLPPAARPAALWSSPEFSFTAHTGAVTTKASLKGKPYIADFVFTTCRTVCPMLTAKFVRLQRELSGADLRFVSFSVDPEHDTVEALAQYQQQWNPTETRWLLLATTPPGLEAVANGFHVTAQRTDGGIDAVMHSAVFLLVDGEGVVRGAFDSEDPEDFGRLREAARALAKGPAPTVSATPRTGEVLFHEYSCSNCHSRPELAPALGGLVGSKVELSTRAIITATTEYVKESIVAPEVKRVNGYPLRMPSYASLMTPGELDALVEYVGALPGPAAPSAEVAVVIDPVCHMQVRLTPNALTLSTDAGVVAFCSAWCREHYEAHPDAYRR
ncbi:MAG: SCO family protein [Myxococcaceae bacterium]